MKLYFKKNNSNLVFSVPDDTDFTLFIDSFHAEQVETAIRKGRDPSTIHKKTPQQILNALDDADHEKDTEYYEHNVQPDALQTENCDEDGFSVYDSIYASDIDIEELIISREFFFLPTGMNFSPRLLTS